MAKSAWGIEAGTSSVKAVKLAIDGRGTVTIEDVSMISLANFRSSGATDQAALLGALREFVLEKNIRPSDTCYISLPGRNAFSRVVSLPPVGDDKIRETIANEARGQIPIKLEEAVWDYQRINSDDGEVEVNLYAVKRDVVDSLMQTCSQAGLPVRGIQLAPLGIYNFVKHELDESISNSCVCIDIGTENSDLVVVDGEKAWLRVVPTAGNDVTKALIMKDQRLNPQTAEALKRNPQAVVKKLNAEKKDPKWPDAGHVLEAMKAPLRELVADIHRSVGFYKNQNPEAQPEHLVMMGNGSRLLNLDKFLRQQLQFDVTRVASLNSVTVGRGLDPAQIAERIPSLVVPIGLALQAVGVGGVSKTNLVPEDLIRQEQLSRTRPAALIGAAIIALCGLIAFVTSMGPKGSAGQTKSELEAATKKVKQINSDWNAVLANHSKLLAKATTLNNLERGQTLSITTYQVMTGMVTQFEKDKGVKLFRSTGVGENKDLTGISATEVSSKLEKIELGLKEESAPKKGSSTRRNRNRGKKKEEPAFGRTTEVRGFGSFAIHCSPALEGKLTIDEQKRVADRLSLAFFDFAVETIWQTLRADKSREEAELELEKAKIDNGLIKTLLLLRDQATLVTKEQGKDYVQQTIFGQNRSGNLGSQLRSRADVFAMPQALGKPLEGQSGEQFFHFEVSMNITMNPWIPEAAKGEDA